MRWSFVVPASVHRMRYQSKKETVEEMIARLDEADAVVDAMVTYPTAEKMLNKLYGKV